MDILSAYSNSGITSVKKFVATSKWRPFFKFWNIKHSFKLYSDMKKCPIWNRKYIHIIGLQLVASIVPVDFGHVWSTILSGSFFTDEQRQGPV